MDSIPERAEAAVVERSVRIHADPATVFRYWTEPDLVVRWMGRTATLDTRPGGTFRVDYNGTDIASGSFVEVDPPRRLVLTWGWEAPGDSVPPGSSRVEVDFTPDGGATVVTVRHLDLPDDSIASHEAGWDHFLPSLETAVGDRGAGPPDA